MTRKVGDKPDNKTDRQAGNRREAGGSVGSRVGDKDGIR